MSLNNASEPSCIISLLGPRPIIVKDSASPSSTSPLIDLTADDDVPMAPSVQDFRDHLAKEQQNPSFMAYRDACDVFQAVADTNDGRLPMKDLFRLLMWLQVDNENGSPSADLIELVMLLVETLTFDPTDSTSRCPEFSDNEEQAMFARWLAQCWPACLVECLLRLWVQTPTTTIQVHPVLVEAIGQASHELLCESQLHVQELAAIKDVESLALLLKAVVASPNNLVMLVPSMVLECWIEDINRDVTDLYDRDSAELATARSEAFMAFATLFDAMSAVQNKLVGFAEEAGRCFRKAIKALQQLGTMTDGCISDDLESAVRAAMLLFTPELSLSFLKYAFVLVDLWAPMSRMFEGVPEAFLRYVTKGIQHVAAGGPDPKGVFYSSRVDTLWRLRSHFGCGHSLRQLVVRLGSFDTMEQCLLDRHVLTEDEITRLLVFAKVKACRNERQRAMRLVVRQLLWPLVGIKNTQAIVDRVCDVCVEHQDTMSIGSLVLNELYAKPAGTSQNYFTVSDELMEIAKIISMEPVGLNDDLPLFSKLITDKEHRLVQLFMNTQWLQQHVKRALDKVLGLWYDKLYLQASLLMQRIAWVFQQLLRDSSRTLLPTLLVEYTRMVCTWNQLKVTKCMATGCDGKDLLERFALRLNADEAHVERVVGSEEMLRVRLDVDAVLDSYKKLAEEGVHFGRRPCKKKRRVKVRFQGRYEVKADVGLRSSSRLQKKKRANRQGKAQANEAKRLRLLGFIHE